MCFQITLTFDHAAADMVKFHSASSEISGRKKKKEESLVKYKSADNCVGRPK